MTETPNEYTHVERPLIEQLKQMGWQHLTGDIDVPDFTERTHFGEVLLQSRLREALLRINTNEQGEPWLDEGRLRQAIGALERLGASKLMEANQRATELLLAGTTVEGDPQRDGGRDQLIRFIDFDHPKRNDFLVINQFRVDTPGGQSFIVPDLVLFVNGIPLVVVECKSPAATDPMEEAITQLLRYSNQREWVEGDEGAERLFHYNQFLVATEFYEARAAAIGAMYEHYSEWKDTSPVPMSEVSTALGVEKLSSQQLLVAGMLRPAHLLSLVRNFILFKSAEGKTTKLVAHYHQFRAVYAALARLQAGQTRLQHGSADQRGGVVWHTQGSGKSLTMAFIVRALRTVPGLKRFKVVVVTDRKDLQKQLSETAALSGETVRVAKTSAKLQGILRETGPDLVFAMIQKYQQADEADPSGQDGELFPVLNEDDTILVLVDEAHRSQSNTLHANLLRALPNCARIGFTGTPIMVADRKRTAEIFGDFIDTPYTIRQSEADGATVPILYEGRTAEAGVTDGRSIDALFEDMFADRSPAEQEAIRRKYATAGNVLEAPALIAAKATDLLRHYVDTVLPNGLKAQVVATSRLAAIRYQAALVETQRALLSELEALDPALLTLGSDALAAQDAHTQFLVRAHAQLDTIRRLEFAAIISGDHNDDPAWRQWSEQHNVDDRIERFKKPLVHADPTRADGLAILCVKSMLLTGFDAPVEQALYLDRFMQGHELLQAIARVNRTYPEKSCGLVVDYFGVGRHLKQALEMYATEDVQGALTQLEDELPKLADRHRRVVAVFTERGITDLADVDACVEVLADLKVRADFAVKFKQFSESLDIVLPRPEALPYVRDARLLGFINKTAANLYRDGQMNLLGTGQKVRRLIDEYIEARGVNPKIPPISILDANFAQAVDARRSLRAKASEMEHAARYHINVHYRDDPAYYKRLSERLETILQTFRDNWEDLVAALRELTEEIRRGRPQDTTGLDPKTQAPFLGILVEEADEPVSPERLQQLAALTVELVAHIQQQIRAVDFWRNLPAQNVLRSWLVTYLDNHDAVPYTRLRPTADRLVDLAKALHTRLVA